MNRRGALSLFSLAAAGSLAARASAQAPASSNGLVGLSIGINDYANLRSLNTAHADARAVARKLTQIGYAVEPEAASNTTDAIVEQFVSFTSRVDPGSAAFLFLAGHGVQVDGRNYYLPANVGPLDNADALADALPLDFFLDALAKARPRQAIVVLDACRDDNIGKRLPGFSAGIASTNAPRGCFIAYSAGFGEFALDRLANDDPSPNGLFTRHLLQHMDGERRIYDVIAATRAQVIEDAQAIGHQQHPAIYDQSRRAYFLDGIERRDVGAIEDGVGTLEGAVVVIAAADDYGDSLRPLASPKGDLQRLNRVLTGLGASVVALFNPAREEVLEACTRLGTGAHRQAVFIWLGRGQLRDVQATAMLEAHNLVGVTRGKNQPGGLEMFSHSDVIEAFRPAPEARVSGEKGAPPPADLPAPLTLIYDCGLERETTPASVNNYSDEVPLGDLPNEFLLDERFHDIALITSTSPGRAKPSTSDRDAASPFVTALINALGRPGLTLSQLTELVAGEVDVLTDGAQAPYLVASLKTSRRPLVQRQTG